MSLIDKTISRYIHKEKLATAYAGCSVSFDGDSFYSYRTEIMRRFADPATGEVYYWLDPTRHSVTTSKHQRALVDAVRACTNATLIAYMERPPADTNTIRAAREAEARFALLNGDTARKHGTYINTPDPAKLERLEKILLFMPNEFDHWVVQAAVDRWCRMFGLTPRPVVYLPSIPTEYQHRTDDSFNVYMPPDLPAAVRWLRLAQLVPELAGMRGSNCYNKRPMHYARVERMAKDLNKNFTKLVKLMAA